MNNQVPNLGHVHISPMIYCESGFPGALSFGALVTELQYRGVKDRLVDVN